MKNQKKETLNDIIIEGNLKAEKDTSTWIGDNWWTFYVKATNGRWDKIQRMDVSKIQKFFKNKLPVY